jgi:hypothetical protein
MTLHATAVNAMPVKRTAAEAIVPETEVAQQPEQLLMQTLSSREASLVTLLQGYQPEQIVDMTNVLYSMSTLKDGPDFDAILTDFLKRNFDQSDLAKLGVTVSSEGVPDPKDTEHLVASLDKLLLSYRTKDGGSVPLKIEKSVAGHDEELVDTPYFHRNTNFMGKGFTYLPEDKRADLYGYKPKIDAQLGADDNVLGNVPFLMAYGNKSTKRENAPYHGTFPSHFTSY